MKKFYISVLGILCSGLTLPALAQQEFRSSLAPEVVVARKIAGEGARAQNVFVEMGGQGLLLTANYDSRFGNRRDGLGGRVGIGYTAVNSDNSATTIPLSLNYLLGKNNKFFEIGLGATISASKSNGSLFFNEGDNEIEKDSNVFGTMSFTYRVQPVDSGFSFRAGITPIFDANSFIPYFGGISLGYTF